MEKCNEIKMEYGRLRQEIQNVLAGKLSDEELLRYFMAAALKIWSGNVLYAPAYSELLSAVSGQSYTIEQIMSALGCCGEPERKLRVPQFFQELVALDAESGSSHASNVLRMLNDLLVAAALINGDFTIEEASCLSSMTQDLAQYAAAHGAAVQELPNTDAQVTERNEESYLQNDALARAAERTKTPQETAPSPSPSPAEVNIPVNITIHVDAKEGGSLMQSEEITPLDEPAERAAVTSPAAAKKDETMESLLAELDGLVGLENVKQDVHSLMNFIKVAKIREQRGMKVPTISYHLVFTGNPGTGKTTVARLVAKLYYHMGILPQGQLVETDRSALVAGYLGQTAIKTQKVIQQAMGGVLFIDEAYSLAGDTEDSYGKEAIETILKAMEDHRDELVVIVAGYTELMHKFIESNPGLSSRFSKYFEFPDYSGEELLSIFTRFCEKNGYRLEPDAEMRIREKFDALYDARDEHFGNARTARNYFEKAINAQADRIAMKAQIMDADLENLTEADILAAIGGGV